jgi:hypothetical protein
VKASSPRACGTPLGGDVPRGPPGSRRMDFHKTKKPRPVGRPHRHPGPHRCRTSPTTHHPPPPPPHATTTTACHCHQHRQHHHATHSHHHATTTPPETSATAPLSSTTMPRRRRLWNREEGDEIGI